MLKLLITINTFITMIITTTSFIQNAEDIKYLGIVSSNVVVGTNFFSDLDASITDIFGGNSLTYENKLKGIYKQAMSDISQKAQRIGANAILGLNIDFDEISGKGKSMFMVSAVGTAAKVKINNSTSTDVESGNNISISKNDVKNELQKIHFKNKFKTYFPSTSDYETIVSTGITGLENEVYEIYLKSFSSDLFANDKENIQTNCLNILEYFLTKMNYDDACDFCYNKIKDEKTATDIKTILNKLSLFNPAKILRLIDDGNYNAAIALLDVEKDEYTRDDCNKMKLIIERLDNLPDIGSIQLVKGGFMSKEKEKYICPNGHQNDVDEEFCSNCGKNIKGLTKEDIESIRCFKEKVIAIDELLQNN